MANHKYSHALVLSHYETSGLLLHDQRRRTPTSSGRKTHPNKTESRVIQEVFSPFSSPPPVSSSQQESYFIRKPLPSADPPPPSNTNTHTLFTESSLNRSNSIVTQIFDPTGPPSPYPEGQHTKKAHIPEPVQEEYFPKTYDEHTSRQLKDLIGSEEDSSHQLRNTPSRATTITISTRPQGPRKEEHLLETSFDTEDESDGDIKLRPAVGSQDYPDYNYSRNMNSTRSGSDARPESKVHRRILQDTLPKATAPKVSTGGRSKIELSDKSADRQPVSSTKPKHPLEPAALALPRKKTYGQTLGRKSFDQSRTREGYTSRSNSTHTEKQSKQHWSQQPSLPNYPPQQEVRYGNPPASESRRKSSESRRKSIDQPTANADYFSSRKASLDGRLQLSPSPQGTKRPKQPAPLEVHAKKSYSNLSTEKPLPRVPEFQVEDPRERAIRVRTRGYASTCRHSWASRNSRQNSITSGSIKPIRNMAPPRESLIRAAAMDKQKAQKLIPRRSTERQTKDMAHISTQRRASSDAPRAHFEVPPRDTSIAVVDFQKPRPTSDESPSQSRPHSDAPSSGTDSQQLSTNTTSRRPSIQTTPPTSPSLASVFSFSSTLSSPKQLEKIPIYNKDMIVLPWDHDIQMGPSLFCTSPPPFEHPISPPSPGSSIDDATPPPIALVRNIDGNRRKISDFTSGKQTPRPRALSSPTAISPRIASPPPAIPHPRPTEPATQEPSRSRLSFSTSRPSFSQNLSAIPYAVTAPGPAPIPTMEKVLVPPPKEELVKEAKEKDVDKKRNRYFWQGGIGVREIFGLGRKGAKPDAGFMRAMVST